MINDWVGRLRKHGTSGDWYKYNLEVPYNKLPAMGYSDAEIFAEATKSGAPFCWWRELLPWLAEKLPDKALLALPEFRQLKELMDYSENEIRSLIGVSQKAAGEFEGTDAEILKKLHRQFYEAYKARFRREHRQRF